MPRRGARVPRLPPSPRRRAEGPGPPPTWEPPGPAPSGSAAAPCPAHPSPAAGPLPAVALKERSHTPPTLATPPPGPGLAPLQPPLTALHPLLPQGARTQPAWCGITPSSCPPPRAQDNKAPMGKRCGCHGFRGGVTREVGAHGGGRHSGLDWSCPPPGLAATPSPACSTHQGCRSQAGHTHTTRHTCPWHSHDPQLCLL